MIKLQGLYSSQYFNLTFLKGTYERVVLIVLCTQMTNQFINHLYRGYWMQHYTSTCWMTIFQKKKKNTGSSYTTSKQKVMLNYRLLYLLYLKLPFISVIALHVLNHFGSVGLRILKMLQTMQNLFPFFWNRQDTSVYLYIHMRQVS